MKKFWFFYRIVVHVCTIIVQEKYFRFLQNFEIPKSSLWIMKLKYYHIPNLGICQSSFKLICRNSHDSFMTANEFKFWLIEFLDYLREMTSAFIIEGNGRRYVQKGCNILAPRHYRVSRYARLDLFTRSHIHIFNCKRFCLKL